MAVSGKDKIKVRKPDFNYDKLEKSSEKYYIKGNAIATHFANALNIIVPIGEQFFIRSVKAFSDQITDPQLKTRVKAFIGQETMHNREHVKFWDVLNSMGFNIDRFKKFYSETAIDFIEPTLIKFFGPELALSTTVALEHYTAFGAAQALDPTTASFEGMAEEVRNLMQWHAVEEIEHKSIAFDVLKEVDDNYLLRFTGFLLATVLFNGYAVIGAGMFIADDEELDTRKIINHTIDLLKQLSQRSEGGSLLKILEYLKPGFHPDDNDNYHIIEPYLEKLQIA